MRAMKTLRCDLSPAEYENARKRILEVFNQWQKPDHFGEVLRVGGPQ
jgi:hypothetical protein